MNPPSESKSDPPEPASPPELLDETDPPEPDDPPEPASLVFVVDDEDEPSLDAAQAQGTPKRGRTTRGRIERRRMR
jgi:hypothetical protein